MWGRALGDSGAGACVSYGGGCVGAGVVGHMTRRDWLQRVSLGLVGACVATRIPTTWLPAPVQSYAACEFLRREVNAWGGRHGLNQRPRVLVVSPALNDAFEREFAPNMRFTLGNGPYTGCLLFKGIPVQRSTRDEGSGWHVTILA